MDPRSLACGIHLAEAAQKKKIFGRDKRIIEARLGLDWWNRPITEVQVVGPDQLRAGDTLGQLVEESYGPGHQRDEVFRASGVVLAVHAHHRQPQFGVEVAILGAGTSRFAFTERLPTFRARWLPQSRCKCVEGPTEANYLVEFLRSQFYGRPVPRMVDIENSVDTLRYWDLLDQNCRINDSGRIWMTAYHLAGSAFDADLKIDAAPLIAACLPGWAELLPEQVGQVQQGVDDLLRTRADTGSLSPPTKAACGRFYELLSHLPLDIRADITIDWLRYHAEQLSAGS